MPLIPGTTKRVLSAVNYAAPAKGSGILLRGASSGSSGMIAAAAGPTIKYTLPASAPASDGESLTSTIAGVMSWVSLKPANNNGAVQFNDNGAFGGDSANFFWDKVNKRLGIGTAIPTKTLDVRGDMLFKSTSDIQDAIKFEVSESSGKIGVAFENTGNGNMNVGIFAKVATKINFILRHGGSNGDGFNIGIDTTDPANLIFTARDSSNSEVMRIMNTGLIGINEFAPDAMMEITTNSSTAQGLHIKGSAAQTASLFRITDSSDLDTINFDDGLAGGTVVFNEQGADIDFRVESDNAANILFLDAGLDTGAGGIGLFGTTPQIQQATIVDADGTLADLTVKFNVLLADLEGYGLLKSV